MMSAVFLISCQMQTCEFLRENGRQQKTGQLYPGKCRLVEVNNCPHICQSSPGGILNKRICGSVSGHCFHEPFDKIGKVFDIYLVRSAAVEQELAVCIELLIRLPEGEV